MGVVIAESQPIRFQIKWTLYDFIMGTGSCGYEWSKEQRHNPYSIAYCCVSCGELWARLEVLDARSKWIFQRRACPKHGLGYLMPSDDDDPKIEAAPEAVLEREILIFTKQLLSDDPTERYALDLFLDGI